MPTDAFFSKTSVFQDLLNKGIPNIELFPILVQKFDFQQSKLYKFFTPSVLACRACHVKFPAAMIIGGINKD